MALHAFGDPGCIALLERQKTRQQAGNHTLFHIYNKADPALGWFHQYQGGTSPRGRKPIKEQHSRIVNINATYQVGEHHSLTKYLEQLPSVWDRIEA